MPPVRASVRLWQTELFIIVIVVAILILSASLTQGLQRTLSEQGQSAQLHNATLLSSQLAEQFPITVESTGRIQSEIDSFHAIYGDTVTVYDATGSEIAHAGTRRARHHPEKIEMALPGVRLEIGVIDGIPLRDMLDHHLAAVERGRDAKPSASIV